MTTKTYERFHETVHILKLKNGMKVHILPKEDPYYTTYVELSLPYGALHLDYEVAGQQHTSPPGSAHFLEHKIFAMPDGDAFAKFSKLGVDANAMTAYNQTSYLFSASDNVMAALEHLLAMIDTPYFTKENVAQEKSIISEELKMYLDDPDVVMQNQLMTNMYKDHPIRHDIGGTLDSIEVMTPELLAELHTSFYQPANRLLVIAGKVDLKALKTFFKDYDAKFPEKLARPKPVIGKETKRVPVRRQIAKMPIGIHKLMIGIKLDAKRRPKKMQVRRELAVSMVLNMLLGPSSKMYAYLLEKELINQNFHLMTTFEQRAENIVIYAETKQINTLKGMLVTLLTEQAKVDIGKEAFERYKKVYLGQFIFALNHLETKAHLYGKYHHLGLSLFDVVDMLQDITFEDIEATLSEFKKRRMATLVFKKA